MCCVWVGMESTQYPAFRSHFPALDVSLEDFVRQRFADVREFNAEWAAREANLACGHAGDASQARPFSRSMSRPSLSERMSGLLHPSTSAQRTYSPALDSLPASARTDRASASFEQEFAAVSIGTVAAATAAGGGGVGSGAAARPAAAMPGAEVRVHSPPDRTLGLGVRATCV
ncbi:MAG: hypothetical protein EOO41_00830 [Methanobacteriota archaeon]|nr:MAG: hypothetical protein EOO41_00830 [Euryarchaeota archaeon]